MSETGGATSATTGSVSTSTTQGGSPQSVGSGANSSNASFSGAGAQGNDFSNTNTNTANQQSGSDDFEEIKIGATKIKVSKAEAQTIKELEKGFRQKSQKLSQVEKMLELAQTNPKKFYQETGKDPYAFAEEWMAEKYEMMQMTPEQKDMKEKEARLKRYEDSEKASKQNLISELKQYSDEIPEGLENKSPEEIQQFVEQTRQSYQRNFQALDQELTQACEEVGFPKDRQLMAKLAFEMMSSSKRGKPLTAKQAASKVINEFTSSAKGIIGAMEISKAIDFLGQDFVNKLREYDIKRVTDSAASNIGKNTSSHGFNSSSSNNQKKQLNQAEWRKAMGIG